MSAQSVSSSKGWTESLNNTTNSVTTSTNSLQVVTSRQQDPRDKLRRFSNASSFGEDGAGPGVLEYAGGDPGEDGDSADLKNDSSSVIRFYPNWCHCFYCLQRQRRRSSGNAKSWKHSVKNAVLCPPQGPLARFLTFMICFFLLWGFAWLVMLAGGKEKGPGEKHADPYKTPAAPEGPLFALWLLELLGLFAGMGMRCVGLPSLLGPLLLGILLRNVEPLNIFNNFKSWEARECNSANNHHNISCEDLGTKSSEIWIKPIREIALTMILTRAGLELSPKQLKKLKSVVPLLAFSPCIVEACACAGFTHLFFNTLGMGEGQQPIGVFMCFVSGFALAAVSPAVVVPGMLSLKKRNYGVGQGVPTLLIAASSIDDVLAISLYTIFMGLALAGGDVGGWTYASGFVSILIGIIHGFVVGIFLHFIPARDTKNKAETRLMILLLFNFVSIFAYDQLHECGLSGAGSLAVLVTSFIASFGWRSQPHWKRPMKKIEHALSLLWTLCVPLLFGTIGREINLSKLFENPQQLGKILGIIFICLFIRCCTAFLVVGVIHLPWKEKLFCAMAWVPKATVQAALAPLVLSKIQELPDTSADKLTLEPHGLVVVTTAVLAILLTAPLGSVLIAFFGPRLLRVATIPERSHLEDEFPNGDGLDPMEAKELHQLIIREVSSSPGQSVSFADATKRDTGEVKRSVSAGAVVQSTKVQPQPTPTPTTTHTPEPQKPEKGKELKKSRTEDSFFINF